MAIRLITGVPGAGKTYLAIHHLLNNYYDYHKESQEYVKKTKKNPVTGKDEDITIITNIDSFKLDHINLHDAMESMNLTIDKFFTVPVQEKISKKYTNIIYFLDEAQRFFPRRNKFGTETWFYFEYHRHLGHDVYVITQDKFLVASNIILLVEYEMRATKRFLSVMGELRYLIKSDGEILDRKTIKPSKKIFSLYRSMDASETEKIKNPMRKFAIALVFFMLICGYMFKRTFISEAGGLTVTKSFDAKMNEISDVPRSSGLPLSDEYRTSPLPDLEPEIDIELSYIKLDDKYFVYDPPSGRLVPLSAFPRLVSRHYSMGSVTLFASYRKSELPAPEVEEKKNPSESSERFTY